MSEEIKELKQKLDEATQQITLLKQELANHQEAITHFINKERADNTVLIEDDTVRELGRKMHTCRVCKAQGLFKSFLAREMMQNKRDEFEYFECDECNCLQIANVPENLGDYYGKGYYSFSLPEDPNRQFNTAANKHDKILDVGCGSGYWLVCLAEDGYDNLYGCDPFLEKDIKQGDRVYIRKCTIHEMDGEGTFDLVRMGDSFEHVTDPLETLKSAARLIKEDGVIMMDIPTYPNIAFDMFGPHWFQVDAPRHIFLHSRKSIEYLADQAGLKVVEYKYNAKPNQIIISFFYQNNIAFYEVTPELREKYFSKEAFESIVEDTKECNDNMFGDHMLVTFTKKETN